MPTRRHLLLSTVALGLGVKADLAFAAQDPTASAKPWMDDRTITHLRDVLGFADGEWDVVSPKIESVLMLMYQRQRFGRFKVPKPTKDGQPRDLAAGGNLVSIKGDRSHLPDAGTAIAEMGQYYFQLISLASEPNPFSNEVKAALAEYRSARAKSDAELAKARASLRELMSLKQEAALVVMGILD